MTNLRPALNTHVVAWLDSAPTRQAKPVVGSRPKSRTHCALWATRQLGLVGILACALAGCVGPSSSNSPTDQAPYTEAAWMAQNRQEEERQSAATEVCMADKGWPITVHPDFSFSPKTPLSDDQIPLFNEVVTQCDESLITPHTRTRQEWQVKYQHALDTRDCLEAHGYKISKPPSEQSWVDAGLANQDIWTPFQQVIEQTLSGTISLDANAYYALYAACPQDGPTAVMSW